MERRKLLGTEFAIAVLAAAVSAAAAAYAFLERRSAVRTRKKVDELDALKESFSETLQCVRQSVERLEAVLDEKKAEDAINDLLQELDEAKEARRKTVEEIEAVKRLAESIPSLDAIAAGTCGFDAVQAKAMERMKNRLDAVCSLELKSNEIIQGILDRLFNVERFSNLSWAFRDRSSYVEAMFANRRPISNIIDKYEELLKEEDDEDDSGK